MPKISFVIPTYNFADFIEETIRSIIVEKNVDLDLIVYDGFSSDQTPEVMAKLCNEDSRIKYVRSNNRANIDIDLNEAILHADGDYIWTMSADDVLVPGWGDFISKLLSEREADIYLVPAVHCTIDMKPYRRYSILRNGHDKSLVWLIHNEADLERYISSMRTSEGLFSFCSACIVKKDKILKTKKLEEANGSCWRYATRIIDVAASFPSHIVISDRYLVLKRGDNDSFAAGGVVRRLGIAICEWERAIRQLDISESMKMKMITHVQSDIGFLAMLYASQCVSSDDQRDIFERSVSQRFDGSCIGDKIKRKTLIWLSRVKIFGTLIKAAKVCVQSIRKKISRAILQASVFDH